MKTKELFVKMWSFARIKRLLLLLIVATLLTHWFTFFEGRYVMTIRNLIYHGRIDRVESEDPKTVVVYYRGSGKGYYNPLVHARRVIVDARTLLHAKVDGSYYADSDVSAHADTNKLLLVSHVLLEKADTVTLDGLQCKRLKFDFEIPKYRLKAGWYSGMVQGDVVQLMLACFLVTRDTSYLRHAEEFGNLLAVPIEMGGVKEEVEGGVWFEEYAQAGAAPHPRVLNGHRWAIDGLVFLTQMSTNKLYRDLLSRGVQALEANIDAYNVGYLWSRYDRVGGLADDGYHKHHIAQLRRVTRNMQGLVNVKRNVTLFVVGKYVPAGVFYRLFLAHNRMLLAMIFGNFVLVSVCYGVVVGISRRVRGRGCLAGSGQMRERVGENDG